MSFNRLDYDKCAYAKVVQESTSPLEYYLFVGKYERCKQCPVGDFTNNLDFGVKTDVESELKGQTRSASKCPGTKYNPEKPFTPAKYSPPQMCESIHYLTPSGVKKPVGPGFDASKLGKNYCNKQ
tara:strand:- start:271 stop:645 length:375 start_codon:yes stop_codon:yes gene_type:complete